MLEKPKLEPNSFTLAGLDILRDVSSDIVHTLSRQCQTRLYRTNQSLIQRCDQGENVFFVIYGKLCVLHHSVSGRDVKFCDVHVGEIVGEIAAIDGGPRSADVVALTDSVVAIMPGPVFKEAIDRYQPFARAIMRRLATRIRDMSERVTEISTLSVRSRVHAELLRLSRRGDLGHNSAIISPSPTHADLASRISTHREAVTREMNHLARAGLVERQSRNLVIRDCGALVKMLSDECGHASTAYAKDLP